MLNLEHTRTFIALAETGGFRETAALLGLSQPTVTQHIRKLELELGAQLIRRSHAGSVLTPEGERFLPMARSLIATADRARAAVLGNGLNIGVSSNIGTYVLPRYVKSFMAAHPGQPVSYTAADNATVARRLENGEIDVAVMEWWDGREGFDADTWRTERMIAIAPKDHPWAKLKTIDAADLLAEPMIGGEPGTGTARLLGDVFGKRADNLKLAMTVGSTEAVKRAVAAGLGVSLVLESAVDDLDAKRLAAVPVAEKKLLKSFWAVVPQGLPEHAPARALVDHLRAA
jgi:DNA-binding transcriptional LysR family regulator